MVNQYLTAHTYLRGPLYFSSSMHFVFLAQTSDLSNSEDGLRGGKLNNNFISPPGTLMIFESTRAGADDNMIDTARRSNVCCRPINSPTVELQASWCSDFIVKPKRKPFDHTSFYPEFGE